MLPGQHKLSSSEQFRQTIRKGKRAGRSTAVVHIRLDQRRPEDLSLAEEMRTKDLASFGGPRCGLVVSKAVGNAVTRHRVSRMLRHIFAELAPTVPAQATVVIRALPPSASASYEELRSDVQKALVKALRRN